MNKRDLGKFKMLLLKQKSELLNRSSLFMETSKTGTNELLGDEADVATGEMSLSLDIRFHERERFLMHKIESALARIDDGTYGKCEECEDELGSKRLEARPVATLCISCKEEQEDTERRYAAMRA